MKKSRLWAVKEQARKQGGSGKKHSFYYQDLEQLEELPEGKQLPIEFSEGE